MDIRRQLPVFDPVVRPQLSRQFDLEEFTKHEFTDAAKQRDFFADLISRGVMLDPLSPLLFNQIVPRYGTAWIEKLQRTDVAVRPAAVEELYRERCDTITADRVKDERLFDEAGRWLDEKVRNSEEQFPRVPVDQYKEWCGEAHRAYKRAFPAHRQSNPYTTSACLLWAKFRSQQVRKAGYDLVRQLPFKISLAYPMYYGHLGENSWGNMLGKMRVVVEEQIQIGRLKRSPGQTLAGKRAADFHQLSPVEPNGDYWGDEIAHEDVVAAVKFLRIPKIASNQVDTETATESESSGLGM